MANNINYEVVHLPIDKIYSDDQFNCRGSISPIDVNDLMISIKNDGLQFCIAVQKREDVKSFMPEKYDYRIIAGHRRFKACTLLGWPTIPAMIREGLSETRARILNLSENFQRKDLNILQEAKALQALYEAGIPRETVAKEIGKSTSWVQVRFNLLSLPEDIQSCAAAGILNQYEIKELYTLRNPAEQYAAVRKIKEAKMRGEKPKFVGKKRKKSTQVKSERRRDEIFNMMELVAKTCGYSLTTRCLAWAAGEVSTDDVFADISEINPDFIPPNEF